MIAGGRTVGVLTGLACAVLSWAFAAPVAAAEPSDSCFTGLQQAFDPVGMGRAEWTRELQRGVGRGANVGRRTAVGRPTAVTRRATVNRANVNVRRTNVNVVRRPVRVWAPRPYYGRVVGGVALGAIIVAAAASVPPAAPAPGLCWFWSDATQTQGYWDYC